MKRVEPSRTFTLKGETVVMGDLYEMSPEELEEVVIPFRQNREVKTGQVKKLITSMLRVGYLKTHPITVYVSDNGSLLTADGQGRRIAAKIANVNVYVRFVDRMTLDEIIAINTAVTTWDLMDFIHAYACSGNKDYLYLSELIYKYPHVGIPAILNILANVKYMGQGCLIYDDVKLGKFKVERNDREEDIKKIESIMVKFQKLYKDFGPRGPFISALRWLLFYNDEQLPRSNYRFDFDRLNNRLTINSRPKDVEPFLNVKGAVRAIQSLYNKGEIIVLEDGTTTRKNARDIDRMELNSKFDTWYTEHEKEQRKAYRERKKTSQPKD